MTFPHTADHLLEQLRQQVRWLTIIAYLVYFVYWWVSSGQGAQEVLRDPHTWVAGLCLVSILSLVLPQVSARISHLFQQVLLLAAVGVILVAGQITLKSAEGQGELFQWLYVVMILLPISFGAITGLTLSVAILLALIAMILVGAPLETSSQAGMFTALFAAAFGYLVMGFIERNLVLHEQANDQLTAARKDALTGAWGRAAIEEELRRTTLHARRTGTPLSLIVTDIDFFKRVNDEFGHGAGDDVLRSFAKRLRRNVGSSGGIVGRWGGEEFLVLLPGLARPEALAMAEHLRHEVSSHPVAGQPITASFGVASFRRAGDDMDSMFARADERLYEAKNAGRNKVRG